MICFPKDVRGSVVVEERTRDMRVGTDSGLIRREATGEGGIFELHQLEQVFGSLVSSPRDPLWVKRVRVSLGQREEGKEGKEGKREAKANFLAAVKMDLPSSTGIT